MNRRAFLALSTASSSVAGDIGEIERTLKLWDGAIESRFRLRGEPVPVR